MIAGAGRHGPEAGEEAFVAVAPFVSSTAHGSTSANLGLWTVQDEATGLVGFVVRKAVDFSFVLDVGR